MNVHLIEPEETAESLSEALKPCPFCGWAARLFTGSATGIACSNDQCVIYTDMPLPFNDHGHLESAISAWNRRAA